MDLLVNIDVDDLEHALRFYCRAFNLTVGRRLGEGAIELLGGTAPIYLLQKQAGTRAAPSIESTRSYTRHWSPVHLDFVVSDIEAAVARATAEGAVLEQPVSASAWGKLALMADPFGHGFCFVPFFGNGYDALAS